MGFCSTLYGKANNEFTMIDLTKYSLVLFKDQEIVFSSDKGGIRPLFECVSKVKDVSSCTLYDKVVGLAAAKLIVYSKMIDSVITQLASQAAADFLKKNDVLLEAAEIVEKIMNKKKTGQCPMEVKALEADSVAGFYKQLENIF